MVQKGRNIVVVGTMDTKAEEALYLKELIKKMGHNPLLMDTGISEEVPFQPDFPREKVALATGRSLEEIWASAGGYSDVLVAMAKGATSILQDMTSKGEVHGVLSMGGSLGTSQALAIMRELPLNLPKLAISTVAFVSPSIGPDVVSIDQVMMQSVADLWGINRITRKALQRAAGAICGMAEIQEEEVVDEKPLVAISCLGIHHYVDRCRALLQEKGYEPVVFHSVGNNHLEKLVRRGYFSGVLDLSAYELIKYAARGDLAQGWEDKFLAATETGTPQVIAPGAIDFFPIPRSESLSDEHKKRTVLVHGLVNLIKSTPQEQEELATLVAEKINKAKGSTFVLVPLKGFSRLDQSKEMPFYEPGAGQRFSNVLKQRVSNPLVEIEEIDAHINDNAFAERATALLLSRMN